MPSDKSDPEEEQEHLDKKENNHVEFHQPPEGLQGDSDEDENDSDLDSPLKLREELEKELGEMMADEDGETLQALAPAPPDGGWGWVICIASFFCNLILDGIAYSFGVMLPALVKYFDSDTSTVSWVGSILCGVYLISGPIVGGLVNRFGCRPVCMAGSVIAFVSFCLSIFANSVPLLMLIYGVVGGFGLGLIYLPAVVAVGYYFEKKRAMATGISVCGSGVGTFVFAPLASYLVDQYGWRGANLIFAAFCLQCLALGALMRPLKLDVIVTECGKLQDDDERYVLTMPDGTKHKQSVAHGQGDETSSRSSSHLDVMTASPSHRIIPMLSELPTIAEQQTITDAQTKKDDHASIQDVFPSELPSRTRKRSRIRTTSESQTPASKFTISVVRSPSVEGPSAEESKMVRNQSAPHFAISSRNFSTVFNQIPRVGSHADYSMGSGSTLQMPETRQRSAKIIIRPLSRKDIFFTGSVQGLQQSLDEEGGIEHHKSQSSMGKSGLRSNKQSYVSVASGGLRSNRHSFISVHRGSLVNSHLALPIIAEQRTRASFSVRSQDGIVVESVGGGVLQALKELLDFSLLKDPCFTLIGISNIFGMLGFYTPFVYLPTVAASKGIEPDDAAFLISVIGISNTVGRLLFGWLSDFSWADSLVMTNLSISMSAVCIFLFTFCNSYTSFVIVALLFGLFVAAYICLTSIVLVDLCGLDKLTTAFGLLTLFRGSSSMVGPPVIGAIFEHTQSYNMSFYASAVFLILAAIISTLVDVVRRLRRAKEDKEEAK